ncbi:hypothetical protein QL285_039112 [Trifolium repens]|nr:hypothetical protein QL285_039112 [Trifolium repens]
MIISFTRHTLNSHIPSAASLQPPGLLLATGFNPLSTSKFFAQPASVTHLTPVAPFATTPSSTYKNFLQRRLLDSASSTILLLEFQSPLQFSTIIPCLPYTILS